MARTGPITEHFDWEEAACRDGTPVPPELEENVVKAAEMMEKVRMALGGRPIAPNSWYRTPSYNRSVGGAPGSQHLQGNAVDFAVDHMTPRQVQDAMVILQNLGIVGGLGRYRGFTHVDRGPKRTW